MLALSGTATQAELGRLSSFYADASQSEYRVTCLEPGCYEQTLRKMVAASRADKQPALVGICETGMLEMMRSQAVYPVSRLMKDSGNSVDWSE